MGWYALKIIKICIFINFNKNWFSGLNLLIFQHLIKVYVTSNRVTGNYGWVNVASLSSTQWQRLLHPTPGSTKPSGRVGLCPAHPGSIPKPKPPLKKVDQSGPVKGSVSPRYTIQEDKIAKTED
jgi:hypothetical protein